MTKRIPQTWDGDTTGKSLLTTTSNELILTAVERWWILLRLLQRRSPGASPFTRLVKVSHRQRSLIGGAPSSRFWSSQLQRL